MKNTFIQVTHLFKLVFIIFVRFCQYILKYALSAFKIFLLNSKKRDGFHEIHHPLHSKRVFKSETYYHSTRHIDQINSIIVTSNFRFGNLSLVLWKTINAIRFYRSVQDIYFPCLDSKVILFTTYRNQTIRLIFGSSENLPNERYVSGDFYFFNLNKVSQFGNNYDFKLAASLALEYHNISLPLTFPAKTACFHFRSGDVFTQNFPNPYYFQPPLSFYIKAYRLIPTSHSIIIVAEDRSSPLYIHFLKWLHANDIKYSISNGTISNDLNCLLSCDTLVASNGTFLLPIYFCSKLLKKVYCSNSIDFAPLDLCASEFLSNYVPLDCSFNSFSYWINSRFQVKNLLSR